MKKIALFLLLLSLSSNAQDKIKWLSFEEALEAQKEKPKKIFMDAYTDWCGPCKLLDKNTFGNKYVADYINENFYPVKFNAEGDESISYKDFTYTNPNYDSNRKGRNGVHVLAQALRIDAYPSMVFFDETGNLIQPIKGYLTPTQLEIYLKLISSDDYKKIVSKEIWEDYQTNFVGTFQD